MIALKEPISRFIVVAHNNKHIVQKSSIEHKIDDLIDIISFRIQNKELETVAESVFEKLFELRFEIFEWFYINNDDKNILTELQEKLNQEIALKIQLSPYSNLAKILASVLDTYSQIINPILDKVDAHVLKDFITDHDEVNKPNYKTIALLQLHPSPQMQYMKRWVDASLKLEFGFLVAELLLTEQIVLSEQKITNLIEFLDTTLIHFGAYSIFTEFWQPTDGNTSNRFNKMEILAATIELDHNIYQKASKDAVYHLIHN